MQLDPGDQAFLSYGPVSNDDLLQFYGFVERENPSDTYVLNNMGPMLREASSVLAMLPSPGSVYYGSIPLMYGSFSRRACSRYIHLPCARGKAEAGMDEVDVIPRVQGQSLSPSFGLHQSPVDHSR